MKTRIIGAIVAVVLAAVGTVVLLVYVGAADVRAARGAALVNAYVVKEEVPAKTAASEIGKYLAVSKLPASAVVEDSVRSLEDLEGMVTTVELEVGEQLITSRFANPAELAATAGASLPEGTQAVTVALEVERAVGGAIKAGDTVGVVVSADSPYVPPANTRQTMHKVLVLDVKPGSSLAITDGAGEEMVDMVMVTLALRTPDVEVVVWGQEFGGVWLTLEPQTADETGGRTVNGEVVYQ
ncbi:Flp pilus assembly protein CpaB [Naasia sp. SYSU D00948]|uniref:Flp pilus assembly protein CpaB n=1 Tax=Naasia sp. SYSU D00948 TaxID=2817379 RepID=UPI001B30799B|nr:RcpC/CpaB family pilus assembly protein [Naasia sp. SYSU D00948]